MGGCEQSVNLGGDGAHCFCGGGADPSCCFCRKTKSSLSQPEIPDDDGSLENVDYEESPNATV